MEKQLMNKKGELTSYGLACGYHQVYLVHGLTRVELYREHNTYHVRLFPSAGGKWIQWESYDTLTEARKVYQYMIRQYGGVNQVVETGTFQEIYKQAMKGE